MTSRHPHYCGYPHCRWHPPAWGGIQNATSAHGVLRGGGGGRHLAYEQSIGNHRRQRRPNFFLVGLYWNSRDCCMVSPLGVGGTVVPGGGGAGHGGGGCSVQKLRQNVHVCGALCDVRAAPLPLLERALPPPVWGCLLGGPWPMAGAHVPLRADLTRSSETGTVRGVRWHTLPRERKGEWRGKDRPGRGEGGLKGVSGRWALPPTERMGPRKGHG